METVEMQVLEVISVDELNSMSGHVQYLEFDSDTVLVKTVNLFSAHFFHTFQYARDRQEYREMYFKDDIVIRTPLTYEQINHFLLHN